MAEYIDKVKLMSRIESELMRWGESEYNALQILGDIEDFPTADVVEVKHGKWYQHNKKEHGDTCYYCSACEKMALSDCLEWELTKYCPNCGAKMNLSGNPTD